MNHTPYTNTIRSWISYTKNLPKASLQNSILSHDRVLSYFGYMRLYAVEYSLGFLSLAITTFTEVMAPKLTGWTVDLLSSHHQGIKTETLPINRYLQAMGFHSPRGQLYGLALIFFINMLLGLLFRFLWRQFLARRTHHSSFVYRMRYWSSLRFTSLSRLAKQTPEQKNQDFAGDLISRGIADINPVRFIHGFTWAGTLDVVFFLVAGSISMIWIDPLLAFYCLAIFPLAAIPVWILSEKQKTYHQEAQNALAELSDTIGQAVGTARLQRATATEGFWKKRLEKEAKTYAGKSLKSILTFNHIIPWATIPTIFAYAFLVYLGIPRVLDHQLSAGDLVAMFSFVMLMQMPLFELGPLIAEWQRGKVSMQRLNKVINQKTPHEFKDQRSESLAKNQGLAIDIAGLVLSTDPNKISLSCQIRAGEKFGVIGPVGTGKSTLLDIIAGNQVGENGSVRVFGEDIRQLDRSTVVQTITLVSQSPFLFSGSIRENLCLDKSMTDPQLWDVLRIVQLDQDGFLREHGLETMIGEFGINLSGGQKQRLCLARALLRVNPIVIFDDCLSAVDTLTEEKILKDMAPSLEGVTVIWAAHRLSTLRLCQRIMTLPSGAIQNKRGEA